MKKQTKIKIFGCCVFILIPFFLKSQIPPSDKNWQVHWIDHFIGNSGSDIDLNRWQRFVGDHNAEEKQWFTNSLNNLYLDGQSHAVIKAIRENMNGKSYTSAWFETIERINYGYFEIRCKLPSGNGGKCPAFWTYGPGLKCGDLTILERGGDLDNSTYTNAIWWDEGSDTCGATPIELNQQHVNEDLTTSYNTFAIEWMPNHAIFYYNFKMGLNYLDDPRVPIIYLDRLTIDFGINSYVNDNIPFPDYFFIDYVKWYTLKTDCTTPVYLDNFNFGNSNYDYKLKKLFELKNSSILSGQNVTLRATDYILLGQNNGIKGEFNVPFGAEFTAIVHDCPDH
jgi:beta-glucanase (GH16 family)